MVLTSSKILWATQFIVAIGDTYIYECKLYWLYKIIELLDLRKNLKLQNKFAVLILPIPNHCKILS
jgi:hypothetical protein